MNLKPRTYKASDLASSDLRRVHGPYIPRQRQPNEVIAAKNDIFNRGIYDGKDLKRFSGRPGAMDAYDLPSRGLNV